MGTYSVESLQRTNLNSKIKSPRLNLRLRENQAFEGFDKCDRIRVDNRDRLLYGGSKSKIWNNIFSFEALFTRKSNFKV